MGQRLTTMGRRTNSSQREQGRLQRRLQRLERLGSILGLLLRLQRLERSARCSVDWSLMLCSAKVRPPSNVSPNQMSRCSSRGVPSWARIFAFTVSIVYHAATSSSIVFPDQNSTKICMLPRKQKTKTIWAKTAAGDGAGDGAGAKTLMLRNEIM